MIVRIRSLRHIRLVNSNVFILYVLPFGRVLLAVIISLRFGVRLLMNQREANVVLKFGNGEIELEILLAILVYVQLLEQLLGEGTDQRLLVIVDYLLEKLIDELNFEVCDIETGIVIGVELVSKVEHDLVPLALLRRVNELVNQALADVLDFAVARDQAIKFELDLVRCVQIRYAFLLVGDEHALVWMKHKVRMGWERKFTYLLIRKRLGAIDDGHVLVLVYWIGFFLDCRSFLFHHLVLAAVRVDPRDEEATTVIFHVVHVVSTPLGCVAFFILLLLIAISWY